MRGRSRRTIAAAFYWLAAVTITLGAYGHGFVGVAPVRAPVDASTLPPEIVRVIWIVWYFVSGCVLAFGALLFWAWPALQAGPASRSSAALIAGALYTLTGITSYLYSGREPFWLLFLIRGGMVIGSTLVLRRLQATLTSRRRPGIRGSVPPPQRTPRPARPCPLPCAAALPARAAGRP